jgi:hypothetical protein
MDDFAASFEPRTADGEPLPPEQRPTRIALDEQRPAHLVYRVTSGDDIERDVAVTAFPLFAQAEEFLGIVAIFWRE